MIVSKYDENKINEIITNLLNRRVSQIYYVYIITEVYKTYYLKDSRSFEELGVLCVCNDRPLPEKQSM